MLSPEQIADDKNECLFSLGNNHRQIAARWGVERVGPRFHQNEGVTFCQFCGQVFTDVNADEETWLEVANILNDRLGGVIRFERHHQGLRQANKGDG